MWRDLQFGICRITRNKLLSSVIVALLAVGIGANTLIFSFIESLLLSASLFLAVIIGLAAGLLSAAFATKLLQRLLFGVQPLDPVAFLITACCVLFCAAIATAFPVFRAMRTDPASALRVE